MTLMLSHSDRLFPADPEIRALARDLHASVRDAPLICPHGHTDPRWFADDAAFSDATSVFVTSDPYVLRLLHGHGVPLERLGVARQDDASIPAADARQGWACFAAHYHLFQGTPSRLWLDAVFAEIFDLEDELTSATADTFFERIGEALAKPEFRPRALFERFDISVLATTDSACDSLEHHTAIRRSGWAGRVVPTFRPDTALDPEHLDFRTELASLASMTGENTTSLSGYLRALQERRRAFAALGATASDHGHPTAATADLSAAEFSRLFDQALHGTLPPSGAELFRAQMLTEMARMSLDDGLVMQLHAGARRGYNTELVKRYGSARGETVPQRVDFVGGLKPLLDRFGHEPNFRIVLFTLDESVYARELAPLAGVFPSVWLGSPWWFHDSPEGMLRFRHEASETAGFYKYAGFVDDTRAFFSIPARHDVARRMDAAFLAHLVTLHRLTRNAAFDLMQQFASTLPQTAYRLNAR
ncbi:glucuronate isomerase (plasmid) [Microvirga ossetica]|uniref:Uronate isomerase n=2 Tax=Microvirga ossetica TaxID=1882682 RepID=A0A1B2EVV6_9HYPH|nr:glucuronate isomerase [Microvirga ossetica]ANY84084.1 glucuronate isomerase [Microvirga ossetica]